MHSLESAIKVATKARNQLYFFYETALTELIAFHKRTMQSRFVFCSHSKTGVLRDSFYNVKIPFPSIAANSITQKLFTCLCRCCRCEAKKHLRSNLRSQLFN
jgi:hypothetical protein